MTPQQIKDAAPWGATNVDDVTPIDILDNVPNGATHYSDVDNDIVFYQVTNNILYWDSDYNIWDEVYFDLPDIKLVEKCKISHVTINHDRILELYDFIAHGSNDHKNWLRNALFAFFNNEDKPEYKD